MELVGVCGGWGCVVCGVGLACLVVAEGSVELGDPAFGCGLELFGLVFDGSLGDLWPESFLDEVVAGVACAPVAD